MTDLYDIIDDALKDAKKVSKEAKDADKVPVDTEEKETEDTESK